MRHQQRLGDLASCDFPITDQCTFSQTRRSDGATPTNGHRLISRSYDDTLVLFKPTFTNVVFPVPPSPTKYLIYDVPCRKGGELHGIGEWIRDPSSHREINRINVQTKSTRGRQNEGRTNLRRA